MAASTMNLLDRARLPLNDEDKTRWPDTELLSYLNEGLALVRRSRPDLFFATLLEEPVVDLNTADVPIPYTHRQPLVDYVSGRAQMKDGDVAGVKAGELLQLSVAGLK